MIETPLTPEQVEAELRRVRQHSGTVGAHAAALAIAQSHVLLSEMNAELVKRLKNNGWRRIEELGATHADRHRAPRVIIRLFRVVYSQVYYIAAEGEWTPNGWKHFGGVTDIYSVEWYQPLQPTELT